MEVTTKALLKSFNVNIILAVVKIIVGFIGRSSALIADGVHSFSDLATDAVALFGNKMSLKPADKEHPFGHGKIEYLTCLVIGLVILFLGFDIIYSAFKTNIVIPSKIVIIVSVFTIISKYILFKYLLKIGYKYNNSILIASGKESSADVISSIFVLLSGVLMQFSSEIHIFFYSNLIATIIVGILIIKTGFNIIKDNISTILGEQEDVQIDNMINIIKSEKKVDSVDNFYVIKNGPYFQITGEISMNPDLKLKEVHDIVEKLEREIKQYDERAKYINIHVNPTRR